jgi:hypothetical protein
MLRVTTTIYPQLPLVDEVVVKNISSGFKTLAIF